MVFESIVVDVLNRFIGDYVENLDRSQLKLGIWGGDVVLGNLELKDNAFGGLDLPFSTVRGRLEKLVLKIPWKNLYGSPVIATIEGIYLLVVPKIGIPYNADKEKKTAWETKQKQLQKIEEAKLQEVSKESSNQTQDGFTEKLVAQIMKNLQVRVSCIHVRYEDDFTNPSMPFALGLTLFNLSFETTDWSSDPSPKFIYKLITLSSLSFYFDTENVTLLSKLESIEAYQQLKFGIPSSENSLHLSFILNPINAVAKLQLNPKPESDGTNYATPKVYLTLDLQHISLSIRKSQFANLMKLLESVERMSLSAPWRKYRPKVPVSNNCAVWWKFAYTCIVEEGVRRRKRNWSMNNIEDHRKSFRSYKDVYLQKLTNKKLPDDLKRKIEFLEETLDVLNITLARKLAEMEYARAASNERSKESYSGWISSWLPWKKEKKNEDDIGIVKRFEEAMTLEEKHKLYEAIDYQENMSPADYPKTFIANDFKFLLSNLSVHIIDDSLRYPQVLHLSLDEVKSSLQMRPSASALKLETSIRSFTVYGYQNKPDGARPIIVQSVTVNENRGGQLLDVLFETNPESGNCDQKIHVYAQPLEIIYHAESIQRLGEVFKTESVELSGYFTSGSRFIMSYNILLQQEAMATMQQIRESSTTGLQHAISVQKILDLKIDIMSSNVIIPQHGISIKNASAIVAQFGHLKIRSLPRNQNAVNLQALTRAGSTDEEKLKEMLEQSYDQFNLDLIGIQILLASSTDNWKMVIDGESNLHLLTPSRFHFNLRKCIVHDDPRLPNFQVKGELPQLCLQTSDKQLLQLAAILFSFPKTTDYDSELYTPDSINLTKSKAGTDLALSQKDLIALSSNKDYIQSSDQLTKLELSFEIGKIKILVKESDESLLEFCINQIGLTIMQKNLILQVSSFIDDISLEIRHCETDECSKFLKMIYTSKHDQSFEKMLDFNYCNVNNKAFDFSTTHSSIEQLIKLRFSKLNVFLHQEALLKLIGFFNNIQSNMDALKGEKEVNKLDILRRSTSTISSVYDYAKESVGPRHVRTLTGKRSDEIVNLQTEVILDCFSVQICNSIKPISNVAIEGLKVFFKMRKSWNEIQAQLINLSVVDPNPKAVYKQIASFGEEDAFNVEVVAYSEAYKRKNRNNISAVDTSLKACIGSVTFVFLNKYISELMCFVDCFQVAKDKVGEVSAAAAKAASKNVKEAYQNASKTKLDFQLKSPIIIIPQNSTNSNALIANLGSIIISNKFSKIPTDIPNVTPVVDRIKVSLDNFQLSRGDCNLSTLQMNCENVLLQPVSFHLNVTRNLSIGVYTELPEVDINGKLGIIQLAITDADYNSVLLVLEENFSEGHPRQSVEVSKHRVSSASSESIFGASKTNVADDESSIFKRLTLNFNMERFMIMLNNAQSNDLANLSSGIDPLAKFEFVNLSTKATIWSNNKITASIKLFNLIWDDARSSRNQQGITRMMHQLKGSENQEMVSINFDQDISGDKTVNLNIQGFGLIFWIDYLMLLAKFFQPQQATVKSVKSGRPSSNTSIKKADQSKSKIDSATSSSMKLVLKVAKSEIMIVQDADDIDTSVIVFENEINLRATLTNSTQNIMLSIGKLQLFSSTYNPIERLANLVEILSPCEINVVLNKNLERTTIDVNSTALLMHISPYTVQLLVSILSSFKSTPKETENVETVEIDYSDLWKIRKLDIYDFWFLKPDIAEEAIEMIEEEEKEASTVVSSEQMIIEAKTIVLTVEIQLGMKTVPLIVLEAGFTGNIRNWSAKKLSASCSFNVEAHYFNKRLDVWEPVIESVDGKNRRPWEIFLDLDQHDENDKLIEDTEIDDIEEVQLELPEYAINIYSTDMLEMTVTKSFLDVLSNLGKVFGEAVSLKEGVQKKMIAVAPYLVQNDTGMRISFNFENQAFEVANEKSSEISDVLLETGAVMHMTLKSSDAATAKKSILQEQDSVVEQQLMLKIDEMSVARTLSVTRTEKRFFPLPQRTYPGDQWGLVAEVTVEDCCKTVTLRSIIQIVNHLSIGVDVYYMTEGGNVLQFCGEIEAFSKLNLPFHAIYTPTNELFLRPSGNKYSASIVPFVWKDLQKSIKVTKVLKCEAKDKNSLPVFINVIGEMEKILYENTRKKTLPSTCYNINLFPTVVFCNLLPCQVSYTFQGPFEAVVLEEGQSKHLLSAEIGSSTVKFKIIQYMDQEWECVKMLNSLLEAVWTFTSTTSKLILDLGCQIQTEKGNHHLTLYCPFWMINKTSRTLFYRRSKKGEKHSNRGNQAKNDDQTAYITHPGYLNSTPILFSFKPKVFFSKKLASIRVEDSDWSDRFTLDTVGSSGCVSCPNKNDSSIEIGVDIRLSNTRLTKIVVFTPFYLTVNNTNFEIQCRETALDSNWIDIPAGQCIPIWPRFSATKKELVLRVTGTVDESKSFKYSESHSSLLALNNSKGGLFVDCHLTELSCIISIDPYSLGMCNVLLINNCLNTSISFQQQGAIPDCNRLKPSEMVYYTWNDPCGIREFIWFVENGNKVKNTLIMDGIGEYDISGKESIFWVSFLDDTQRVLLYTDDLAIATNAQCTNELERISMEIKISLPGIGISVVDNLLKREVLYLALTSSGVVWESSKIGRRRWIPMNIKDNQNLEVAFNKYDMELRLNKLNKKVQTCHTLDGNLKVDFAKERIFVPEEKKVRRNYQPGLWIQYSVSPHNMQLHLKINRLQIDNQLHDCVFPTIFAPAILPKTVVADAAPKSFIEASIVIRKNEHNLIKQYKYFKVLVQEFNIKLDQGFINALITLFQQPTLQDQDKVELTKADMKVANMELMQLIALTSSKDVKNFYDILHFSPLKVGISFSMQGGSDSDSKKPTTIHSEFLNVLLQSVGVTLTEIQDVVFRLGFFEKQHVFMSDKQLINEVIFHFAAQAVKQMYVVILGLDVIGNPYGLVMGLGKGLEDFFYEPFQGAVQGPEEFAEGLALGIKSLLGHTVGGAAGVFSRITGTLGKGVAALTMDDEYQKKRREALNKRPANLQQGLAQSGKGLFMGVYDGVTGVFVKPIEGAKQEGVGGFFKGMGKGVVGLVARPASGVMDFASGSFDAVKRAADLSEDIHKIRPSRFFRIDGRVRSYVQIEAEGNHLLLELDKGKFAATDNYIAHAVVTQDGRAVLLVTDKRVIMICKGDIFGQWNCEWNYIWDDLNGLPQLNKKGLLIQLKANKKGKKVLGIFGKDMSSKLVEIKNLELVQWIIDKIEMAMKSDL